MLDVIARLLLSAGILIGTTYLPTLSQAVAARATDASVAVEAVRTCGTKPASAVRIRAVACTA